SDFKIGAAARYPILVISYELYRNHGKVINATEGLGLLIADEGHRLKNSAETKTTRALKACPAVMRLVLTGTPMQNDLDEFFAVADFVNPGLLGSLKSFRSRYTRPIKAAWDRDANEDAAELSDERTRELGEMTEKFVLRRTKDVIRGSLPAALEVVVFCRPSARQLSLYKSCIAGSAGARSLLYGDGGDADSDSAGAGGSDGVGEEEDDEEDEEEEREEEEEEGEEEDGGGVRTQRGQRRRRIGFQGVLPLISKLRRLCNHPDLVEEDTSAAGELSAEGEERQGGGPGSGKENSNTPVEHSTAGRAGAKGAWKVPRASGAAAAAARGGAKGLGKPFASTAAAAAAEAEAEAAAAALPLYETEASGKATVLEALLKAVRREYPGDKVVVASNFTSALDVLETLAERNAWGFLRLDGGTTTNARQNLVDRFNRASPEDLFLFLLSTKAGGVGLNLVGANRIVLFDSDWNPATDDQAMARVWRLGQTKEVSMYRLLSTGTLEESIFQRQIFKGALYDLIHDSNDDPSKKSGGGSGGGRHRRGGGDDGTAVAAAAAAAAGKEGGGKSGRGFSQEELKELFVLKTETRSDTYDKLRRGRAAATPRAAGAAAAQEGGRYQETTPEREAGARGDGEEDGGRGPTAAAAPVVAVEEEAWEDYGGPSAVVDKALRLALLEEATGTSSQVGAGAGAGAGGSGAGGVVTFVREVKRGGKPEQQRDGSGGVGTGGASRSPFAALEGVTGNGCGMEGNEA
ncbi:unnamed protein product, partial [Ectocarpus sp. 8 AP-2014]